MTTVTFHHPDGHTDTVDVPSGVSLMRSAILNGIDGILGECGGQCMCATCHVYVHDEYLDALPPLEADEEEMLENTASPRTPRSRLCCQLRMNGELAHLAVDLPEQQV